MKQKILHEASLLTPRSRLSDAQEADCKTAPRAVARRSEDVGAAREGAETIEFAKDVTVGQPQRYVVKGLIPGRAVIASYGADDRVRLLDY
jgi:hypothetical protein